VKLGGKVDALVFAGGIGEQSALLRKAVVQQTRCLEFGIDDEKNNKGPAGEDITVTDISRESSKSPRVLICQTNEQVGCPVFCDPFGHA
jgi:acetate kinase